jgi:transcriptional regulator with XRE-family HTH domain
MRELRKERHMSQEALALEAETNRSYLSGVERGVRNISLTNIVKLAEALDLEISDVFVRAQELRAG